jgi:hypothetical protein
MKSGIIPTVGNKIDPEAADRSRAENLDPFRGRPHRVPAVLTVLLRDGPQHLADRLALTALDPEDAATAVAHFSILIEGIADRFYYDQPLQPARPPILAPDIDFDRLKEQACGEEFEACLLAEIAGL